MKDFIKANWEWVVGCVLAVADRFTGVTTADLRALPFGEFVSMARDLGRWGNANQNKRIMRPAGDNWF